jgi:hypothetical protein
MNFLIALVLAVSSGAAMYHGFVGLAVFLFVLAAGWALGAMQEWVRWD